MSNLSDHIRSGHGIIRQSRGKWSSKDHEAKGCALTVAMASVLAYGEIVAAHEKMDIAKLIQLYPILDYIPDEQDMRVKDLVIRMNDRENKSLEEIADAVRGWEIEKEIKEKTFDTENEMIAQEAVEEMKRVKV